MVTPPRQSRSRATMERVLVAAEELLEDKPFDQITISEIAARSSSSPTSIYARFSDKTALLLAVHERFKERAEVRIVERLEESDAVSSSPEDLFAIYASELVALYRKDNHLLRSVILADSEVMYGRAAQLVSTISSALADRLEPAFTADASAAARGIDFGVRAVMAVMQQEVVFDDRTPGRFDLSDQELTTRLTGLLLDTTAQFFR